jgi:cytochrome b
MSRDVLVWSGLVRCLHWGLAALTLSAWFTGGSTGPVHERLGYAALAVVVVRVVWGGIGDAHARFSAFVRGPRYTWAYAKAMAQGLAPRHIGHNPLGAWMILALLSCVGLLGLTGWLYTTDWLWGYAWLEQLHGGLGWLLLALVAAHLCGVVLSGWQHRENLVAAMIHGRKRPPA